MTEYDEAIVNKEVQLTSLMMAVPYSEAFDEFIEAVTENGEVNKKKFWNLVLDKAIENIDANKEFKYLETMKSIGDSRFIKVEYKGEVFPVNLFFDVFEKSHFASKTALVEEELREIENVSFGLVVEIMFDEDIEKSYMFQLKLVNSIFHKTLVLADLSSDSMFSGKWLHEVCRMSAMPSPTYLFTIHSILGDNGEVWQHTHGLRRCNLFELEILNATKETALKCGNLLSYLGLFLLTSDKPREYEPLFVGRGIIVILINYKEAMKRYENILGCTENDRTGHDEFYMSVFVFASETDVVICKLSEAPKLLDTMEDPIFFVRNSETTRMAKSAKVFFGDFLRLVELDESYGIIKGGIVVDDEYQDDDEEINREHLWFKFIEYNEEVGIVKGILLNQPYYISTLKVEDTVTFNFDEITDWIVYVGENSITPSNVYLTN